MISEYPVDNPLIERQSIDDFLNLLRSYPCLYNKGLKEFHDKTFRENALGEISRNMYEHVNVTAKRLQSCLQLYHKEKNLQEIEQRSGSGRSTRTPWAYFDSMNAFMKDVQIERSTYCNVNSSECTKQSTPKSIANKNNKDYDPVFHSLSKFDTALNNFQSASNAFIKSKMEESLDEETLIGKMMEVRLNKLSPKFAKKKINRIFGLFSTEDSDSD